MKAVIDSSTRVAAASFLATAFATAVASAQPATPPKAAQVTGPIQQVELGPVFANRYLCVEHALELEYAGDALGTDCVLSGGVEIGGNGYLKLYRTDGKTNADWYGWQADVLAPFDGTVVHVHHDTQENVPGVLGPSSYRETDAVPLQIRWDLRAMAKKRAEAGVR